MKKIIYNILKVILITFLMPSYFFFNRPYSVYLFVRIDMALRDYLSIKFKEETDD